MERHGHGALHWHLELVLQLVWILHRHLHLHLHWVLHLHLHLHWILHLHLHGVHRNVRVRSSPVSTRSVPTSTRTHSIPRSGSRSGSHSGSRSGSGVHSTSLILRRACVREVRSRRARALAKRPALCVLRVLRVLRGVCALREGMRARSGKTSGRRGVGRVERVSRRRQSGAGGVETRVGPVGKARTQQTVGGAKRRLADLVRGGGSVDRTGLIDGI